MYGEQTGYTHYVADGTITTGKDFLKLCAREFGACCRFRDEPLGTPLEELVKDTWDDGKLRHNYYKLAYITAKRGIRKVCWNE